MGFGFVTYLMPEHAVKAFNKLDGQVFQGRLLHILPGRTKKSTSENQRTPGKSEILGFYGVHVCQVKSGKP